MLLIVIQTDVVFGFEYLPKNVVIEKGAIQSFISLVKKCTWRIPCYFEKQVGAFTTISSTALLSNFPTTYNDNLNITMETGTTSVASITTLSNLATIGTITSGTWNGSTLTASYGGMGSTTLSQFRVLLGSSTNPVGIVNGVGSSGQFLTSQGDGLPPQWTTGIVDQGAAYSWTGVHNWANDARFNGTTYSVDFNSSGDIFTVSTTSGQGLAFRHNQATTSSPFEKTLQTFTTNVSFDTTSTTVVSLPIDAWTLATSSVVSGKIYFHNASSTFDQDRTVGFCLRYASVTMACISFDNRTAGGVESVSGSLEYNLFGAGTNAQEGTLHLEASAQQLNADGWAQTNTTFGVADVDSTVGQTLTIVARTTDTSFTVINGFSTHNQR